MELTIIQELEKNAGLHAYLYDHSYWYRLLNRDSSELENLKKEYKNYKKENNYNKISKAVENVELVTNIMKFVE